LLFLSLKAELQAGLEYLTAERKTPREPEPAPKADPKPAEPPESRIMTDSGADSADMAPRPLPPAADSMAEPPAKAEAAPKKPKKEPKLKQKRDEWTQYVRVLLSSSEFTFVE